jgi:CubicO group peptidase (beta-lactamase class C family)
MLILSTQNRFPLNGTARGDHAAISLHRQSEKHFITPKSISVFMKTSNLRTAVLCIMTGAATLSTSCSKKLDSPLLSDKQKVAGIDDFGMLVLDPVLFANNIEAYMNGKVAGYGYTIYHNGVAYFAGHGGGGWARKAVDAPATRHGAYIRQGTASCTKFISALATVALLEKCEVDLEEKIYTYLPTNWKPTAEFKELDFAHLLSHRTGLIKYGGTWADLKKTVEGGVQIDEFKNEIRDYDNINYAMLPVILPYMLAKRKFPLDYNMLKSLEGNPDAIYKAVAQRFITQVRVNVFKKANLAQWDIIDYCAWNENGPMPASLGTLGYPTANGVEKGSEKDDNRWNGGAGGLYISAADYAKVQSSAALGVIVGDANYQRMRNELLGFDGVVTGAHGKYTWKNGGANNHETMIFDFGNTQLAVFANSPNSEIANKPSILATAFDKAWVIKE